MSAALLPTYARADLAFERGEGAWLYTAEGDAYLDFGSGVAVTALGHAHPHLVEALTAQARRVWHVSNVFRIPEQERLGERLVEATFADYAFFQNSGAEANELAIKIARKYQSAAGRPERYRIVTFEGAFHGRTMAALAAGGQKKYLEGFGPPVQGFDQVAFGDHDGLKAAITPETAAIMVEPIQGEGGVRSVPPQCLRGLRDLCDEHGLLLVFDEIQTGMGRTGTLFAHEKAGMAPDIMSVAKGLGGGFPVGAVLTTQEAGACMTAGTHGTTFGGNPLAMAVGNAVLDVVLEDGFLEGVGRKALLLKQKLASLKDRHSAVIEDIRGDGFLVGLKCRIASAQVSAAFREHGLLTINAGDNVVRLLPPLIVSEGEIEQGVDLMDAALTELSATMQPRAAE